MKKIRNVILFLLFLFPIFSQAQSAQTIEEYHGTWRAQVISVVSEERILIPGTDTTSTIQTLSAQILDGERKGDVIEVQNDFLELEKGDTFFLDYLITKNGEEIYTVSDKDRRLPLLFFGALFVATILLFGGLQGLRSLFALFGSLFVIGYVLIPSLLEGYPPVATSVIIAIIILFIGIFVTHGRNKESLVAFMGTCSAVLITGLLAVYAVDLSSLSGFGTDESVFLNMKTDGRLDIAGLLLGGILIGILGVLDDIAVTQAAVVRELFHTDPSLSRKEVYKKALRVGREHVGALVNTLALAYTGTSLPLLLLFYNSEASTSMLINSEIFATEIIRTIIGSIGLVLTVPITTGLAVWMLKNYQGTSSHSHHHHH